MVLMFDVLRCWSDGVLGVGGRGIWGTVGI